MGSTPYPAPAHSRILDFFFILERAPAGASQAQGPPSKNKLLKKVDFFAPRSIGAAGTTRAARAAGALPPFPFPEQKKSS